jgi:hypothetical protein
MTYQPTAMQLAARANGMKGGLARARNLSATQRSEIATRGGNATKDAYGVDLYSHIGKLRKVVGRNRKPVN